MNRKEYVRPQIAVMELRQQLLQGSPRGGYTPEDDNPFGGGTSGAPELFDDDFIFVE